MRQAAIDREAAAPGAWPTAAAGDEEAAPATCLRERNGWEGISGTVEQWTRRTGAHVQVVRQRVEGDGHLIIGWRDLLFTRSSNVLFMCHALLRIAAEPDEDMLTRYTGVNIHEPHVATWVE